MLLINAVKHLYTVFTHFFVTSQQLPDMKSTDTQ